MWLVGLVPYNLIVSNFFARMKDLVSKSYFHGFLSDTQSDAKLTGLWESTSEKKAYYLIKYSMESIGEFKLCFVDTSTGRIESIIIRNFKGAYKVATGQKFESWKKLKNAMSKLYNIGKPAPQ